MELQFPMDGAYTLDVTGTDALGNTASVSYTGEAPQAFTIDRTPPLIEVTWDNTDARNGRYYNAARLATVRVADLSFDDSYVKIFYGRRRVGFGLSVHGSGGEHGSPSIRRIVYY